VGLPQTDGPVPDLIPRPKDDPIEAVPQLVVWPISRKDSLVHSSLLKEAIKLLLQS